MNHLLRSIAPISDSGWSLLDEEASERLAPALAARKLVDFSGPQGWEHSATNLGRVNTAGEGVGDVGAHRRRVLPLVELRDEFVVSRAELRDADRGAADADLKSLDDAAQRIAGRRTGPSAMVSRPPASSGSHRRHHIHHSS